MYLHVISDIVKREYLRSIDVLKPFGIQSYLNLRQRMFSYIYGYNRILRIMLCLWKCWSK
jgi:hypothetical protein